VEMNWFLLTLPVSILYESTGMPKIRSGSSVRAGSEAEMPEGEVAAAEGAAAVSSAPAGAGFVMSAVAAPEAVAGAESADAESATAAVALSEAVSAVPALAFVTGLDAPAAFSAAEGCVQETAKRSEAAISAGKRAVNLIQQC